MSYADSLAVALTNLSYGFLFISLGSKWPRILVPTAAVAGLALMIMTRNEIYLPTGWPHLEAASQLAMVGLIACAAVRYALTALREEKPDAEDAMPS